MMTEKEKKEENIFLIVRYFWKPQGSPSLTLRAKNLKNPKHIRNPPKIPKNPKNPKKPQNPKKSQKM